MSAAIIFMNICKSFKWWQQGSMFLNLERTK